MKIFPTGFQSRSFPVWNVVGVGDINGDGFADVGIENHSTGQIIYANTANGVFSGWPAVATFLALLHSPLPNPMARLARH
jgi:hypothetical protein